MENLTYCVFTPAFGNWQIKSSCGCVLPLFFLQFSAATNMITVVNRDGDFFSLFATVGLEIFILCEQNLGKVVIVEKALKR